MNKISIILYTSARHGKYWIHHSSIPISGESFYIFISVKQSFQFMNSRREELVFVINKFEFSVPFPILIIKNPDFSMPDPPRSSAERHNRKYPVIKHSIQKRPGTVGLPNRLHKNMMLRSILLKQLPGSASLFTHSKRFPHKILYLNAFFPIKWMDPFPTASTKQSSIIGRTVRSGERISPSTIPTSSSERRSFCSISLVLLT